MIDEIKIVSLEKQPRSKKYKVITTDNEYIVSEDIVVKYQLLKDKTYTKSYFEEVVKAITLDYFFNKTIHLLSISNKSEYEIIKYIHTQEEKNSLYLTQEQIDFLIEKLKEYNYLDDKKLCISLIDYYIRNNKGPLYIKQKLKEKKINETIIKNNLSVYTSQKEEEIIVKILSKESNKNLPINKLKQTITSKLIQNGFTSCIVYNLVNKTIFEDKSEQLINKDYLKIYNKVKDKDKTENEKKQLIINYLLNKGYDYRLIKEILNNSYN